MTDRMSGSRRSEVRCFNENSPRPPVPGEETGGYNIGRIPPQSPALTPRRSLLARSSSGICDASAPMGFEPEGCCDSSIMETNSPPACLRWATNLNSLLQDREGLQLFRKYLEQEGTSHANPLDFYFACEGLNQEHDKDKVHQLIKAINRRFLQKTQLAIPEHIRKEASRRVKEGRADKTVFDAVQHEVERVIKETIYPNFLSSEIYLGYVSSCQNADSAGCPSSTSSREMSISCGPALLPTLHEDAEFFAGHYSHSACGTPGELRLTRDVLMRTQQTRAMDLRPKTEALAGMYLHPTTSPYHMRSRAPLQYSSYNPVSRQDSELQSLSSDARTESDNLSLTDNSVDGMSIGRSRSVRRHGRESKALRTMGPIHSDPTLYTVIPRTQRVTKDICVPTDPAVLGPILIQKLEAVRREQENEEKLNRHLQEADSICMNSMEGPPSSALADALREKLQIEDDDQAILDQHVSRVWSDPTPSRSPRFESPRGHSPERCKRNVSTHNYTRSYKQRKEKDVFSTFSADSGNIHDFPEGSDLATMGSFSSLGSHIPKSKSVPSEYADSLHKPELYYQGHDQRFRRADMSRRSATKKSMTELTDSGVSVVSDVPPVPVSKEHRLHAWLNQNDKKGDGKHHRHGKKYGSRSGSLERAGRESWGVPSQPFVTDPGMPPLPPPNTAMQLEEARRRLMEEDRARGGAGSIIAPSSSGATSRRYPTAPSNTSTLRKKQDTGDFTTAIFSFCDENVPYRIKIPGHNVTLKQFKEYLPKRGSYRYFFTTECEDVDTKIIQEEITDDTEVLPLWEGKIKAQVKALE
ncbi:axin isoform X1 [Fopius arisanus]|uniref:AXNR_0 protein n=1 Tax=Fopius arisanus TaxID=64838 RepID=A0A0C9R5T9_9HYME|nr:PREDICTED: axin isoform X1 [Fopius arisanus]XP_011305263.1 PREDICTED: axin isoform X1 [Fopius arisanus]XP_011305264.1 PREDICTED: axin isoform X1 [Fopius arisanus]